MSKDSPQTRKGFLLILLDPAEPIPHTCAAEKKAGTVLSLQAGGDCMAQSALGTAMSAH